MRFVVAPFVVAGCLLAAPVTRRADAQVDSREGIALQNQIYQLRQELKAVQDQAGARRRIAAAGNRPTRRRRSSNPAEANCWLSF